MSQTEIRTASTSQSKLGVLALYATLALSGIAWIGALAPLPELPASAGTDKTHHLIAFAVLTAPTAALYPRALWWVLPLIVAQGALIELIQPFANRYREWADFEADLKGVAIGLACGLLIGPALRRALSRWAPVDPRPEVSQRPDASR